ncbi:Polygalacturonase 1 [Sclerotinia borealis F-4128]|uniref:galacturonan 1,4-alpha-galacturonidase n=1 Tax=Sclerotinia borealis (strain F-4128) TaxID=1432307 RepID=W9CTP2_SCLBF|nr:Polygalacturonase 1 [Sclerotinia borealis F-4128]
MRLNPSNYALVSILLLSSCAETVSSALSHPEIIISPLQPSKPHLTTTTLSTPRNRNCHVSSLGSGFDDSAALLSAIKSCNHGGVVQLNETIYKISTPLNLQSLQSIDFNISGTIQFSPNITYWTANSFKYVFQNSSAFWQWGGNDINWYGGGTIDGNGQSWWDAFAKDSTLARPILFVMNGLNGGSMSGLKMRSPPNWFNFITGSEDVLISGMTLTAVTNNLNPVKNSGEFLPYSSIYSTELPMLNKQNKQNRQISKDGWDTYLSSHITIQNSTILNTDDCVSFKPNSSSILVQNLACTGSHGISVGSLGQYVGVTDIVEDIYIYNNTLSKSGDAARIKVWAGAVPNPNGSLPYGVGGGNGSVRNVTYDSMTIAGDDYSIELTSCYMQTTANCNAYLTKMIIQDVVFKNFAGVSSTKYAPKVGTLICSSAAVS